MGLESETEITTNDNFSPDNLAWLGGALEAGGTISFRIQRYPRRAYADAYPLITLQETREVFIDSLGKQFGGYKRQIGNSYQWTLFGYKAAELISLIEPYTISRREMVIAVQNWLNSTTDERVQIAEEMKGHNRYQVTSAGDYEELLDIPSFTAGVIDNRGLIYPSSRALYSYPRVAVSSKNNDILLALQAHFSGTLTTRSKALTEVTIGKRTGVTRRDGYLWTTANNNARELIEYTLPYLRILPYEGWDKRLINEIRENRAEETDSLLGFIRDELEKFQRGETQHLSTKEELANKFQTSARTIKRRLSALEKHLRHQRHYLLLTQNAISHNEKYGNPAKKTNI